MRDLRGYQLLHEGSIALSQVEHNGMRIDEECLDNAIASSKIRVKEYLQELRKDEIYNTWSKRYGMKTNLMSGDQLAFVFFNILKYPSFKTTEKGKKSTDEEAFAHIDIPFVHTYFKMKKLEKAAGTFLKGIKKEVVNGYIHPSFNLHSVDQYRSSCDSPNVQNQIVRNPEMAEMLRRCFIPREGNVMAEVDYSQIEVRVAACYHKDPAMLTYINDATTCMHRDTAQDVYLLTAEEMGPTGKGHPGKDVRYCAKNQMVFPQFYGSYYIDCAKDLWQSIGKMKLTRADGASLKEHLRERGITSLGACDEKQKPVHGTFEHHVKQVEQKFWNERFPVYTEWKEKVWTKYCKEGKIDLYTGFTISGVLRRNKVLNGFIQGPAFHCLLLTIIELQGWLNKYRMKTKIISEIHDCLITDGPESELQDVLYKTVEIMTRGVPSVWNWIITPLETEVDVVTPGKSWHDKETWVEEGGKWQPKGKKQ